MLKSLYIRFFYSTDNEIKVKTSEYEELVSDNNAKYHCFVSDKEIENGINHIEVSLCGRHRQKLGYYENIESGQVLQFPAVACKKCFEKWKKQFNIVC